jgi:hypothetical protein
MAMPWLGTNPMFERHHFAQDIASGLWTMTQLCARYGISRISGYRWQVPFLALGVAGLAEHSRATFDILARKRSASKRSMMASGMCCTTEPCSVDLTSAHAPSPARHHSSKTVNHVPGQRATYLRGPS